MEIKEKTKRSVRNSFVPSKTMGVRAHLEWWKMVDAVAKAEETSRNELIIRVVRQYCEGYDV